jgi:trehalose 2-sulfotransferase
VTPDGATVICALPRTGSSLVGEIVGRNCFGNPAEWFWREDMARNKAAWGATTFADYLERVLERGTSEQGVFGVKIMWGYFAEVLAELRRLHEEPDDVELLRALFGEPRFVWVRRRDAVAQAVSWAKALQTSQWGADQPSSGTPAFDFEQVDELHREAREHDAAWDGWFSRQGIAPFEVVYEDLEHDLHGVMRDALGFLGLRGQADLRASGQKQADEVSAEWIRRYRELAG